jgi:hypothetical protein
MHPVECMKYEAHRRVSLIRIWGGRDKPWRREALADIRAHSHQSEQSLMEKSRAQKAALMLRLADRAHQLKQSPNQHFRNVAAGIEQVVRAAEALANVNGAASAKAVAAKMIFAPEVGPLVAQEIERTIFSR